MSDYTVDTGGRFPIKAWTKGVQVKDVVVEQLRNIAPRMFSRCSRIRKTPLKTPFFRQRHCGFQPWRPPIRKTVPFRTARFQTVCAKRVRRPCDPDLRARAGGGLHLRPAWVVRATVGQVGKRGFTRALPSAPFLIGCPRNDQC